MWLLAWSFHVTLATAFVGHLRVLTGVLDRAMGGMGLGRGSIAGLSTIAGGTAGIVLLAAVVTLLARRVLVGRVREISAVPDFLALLLLVAVITTGNLMRFGTMHVGLAVTRTWAASLFTLSPAVPPYPTFLVPILGRASDSLHGVLEAHALRRVLLYVLSHQEESAMSDQETVVTAVKAIKGGPRALRLYMDIARSAVPAPRFVPSTRGNAIRNTTRPIAPTSSEASTGDTAP